MRLAHLDQLKGWLNNPSHSIPELRNILGEILKSVNEASLVYKKSIRNPSPENAAIAAQVINDVGNYDSFKQLFPQVEQKLDQIEGNQALPIKNILHTLEKAQFSPEQVQELRQSISKTQVSRDFPEETNKEGLDNLLNKSIYNLKDPSDKTLKVVREILQNAVDATDPNQHPELRDRPGFRPEIHINSYDFGDYMDIVAYDKGIGMNWDILSKKFFVTFDSGKGKDSQAAGGFGIAKALIQETPAHGWSIDTNGIHSSRFHKNVYFGTRQDAGYQPPTSRVQSSSQGGTHLSLYGLPKVSTHSLKDLAEVYATNGRVAIFLNKEQVKPRFTLDSSEVRSMDNLKNLPDLVANNESEKQIAASVFDKIKGELEEKIKDISLHSDPQTKVKFFIKKTSPYSSGKLYVMVNGQYQFDSNEYIDKLDVICSIQTSARPGSEYYPLDPGRGMVKGKVGEEIKAIVSAVKEFTSKTSEDDLFKQGIEAIMVNKDASPMSTHENEETQNKRSQLKDALYANLSKTMHYTTEEQTDSLVRAATQILGDTSTTQQDIMKSLMSDVIESEGNLFEQKEKINAIIEGLMTPANIMIQKNFVARESLIKRMDLVAEMTILWQKTLKLLIQKMAESGRYEAIRSIKFIPGMILSDEALGLYMPPDAERGRPYASISINPITLAAAISPKVFNQKLNSSEGAFTEIPSSGGDDEGTKGDTPISRIAKFLFHIGLHELCHLLYPDGWSSENFHKNITKMEIIAHDAYEEIKQETKKYMKKLRSKSNMLLTLVAKHKKTQAESFGWEGLSPKQKSSTIVALFSSILLEKIAALKR